MPSAGNNRPFGQAFVLDSYSVLSFLEAEAGADEVEQLLEAGRKNECHLYMCVINLGEMLYIIERERGLHEAQRVLAFMEGLPVEIVAADRDLALAAAHVKAQSPIAYAGCFAAALARMKDAALMTGDAEFRKIKPRGSVRIKWIKRQAQCIINGDKYRR